MRRGGRRCIRRPGLFVLVSLVLWAMDREGPNLSCYRYTMYARTRFGRAAVVKMLVEEGGADPTLGPSLASTPLAAVRRHRILGAEARAACERVLEVRVQGLVWVGGVCV